MRFAWVTLTIIFMDMMMKLIVSAVGLESSVVLWGQKVQLELLSNNAAAFLHFFQHQELRLTAWLLLGGLLLVFLVLFQVARGYLNSTPYTGFGVQAAAGGIIAQVFDLLIYGTILPLFRLEVGPHGTLQLEGSFSDVAIILGAITMLVGLLQRQFTPRVPQLTLARDHIPRVDFSKLPRGIDNVHIDVALSPSFIRSAQVLIDYLIGKFLSRNFNEQMLTKLSDTTLDNFRTAYTEMVRAAIFHAKETGMTVRIELLHLAVIKFLQEEIQTQTLVAVQRITDRQGRNNAMRDLGSGASSSDRINKMFLNRNALFYKVSQALFRLLLKTENSTLRKLQSAVHGEEQEMAITAMSVPLVQAASPIDEDVLLSRYVLLGHMDSDPFNFPRVDNLLSQVFANCLSALEPRRSSKHQPEPEGDELFDATATVTKELSEDMAGTGEYLRALNQSSVLMVPENITRLLDQNWLDGELMRARENSDRAMVKMLSRQRRFQRAQMANLRNALENANLISTLLCAYEVAELYHRHPTCRHPGLLMKAMNQEDNWFSTRRRIQTFYRSNRDLPPMKEVLEAIKRVRKRSDGNLEELLLRFARDFANYRHDLRLDFLVQQLLNEIRILVDERDILTSRSNQTLHEYLAASEQTGGMAGIKSHVIIKADLRGSTTVTDELIRRKLNPATHFHRHFFQPINEVIQNFGAEKVFIEGDAVILIITEVDTSHDEHLTVSRACGLASGIMRVVEQQNIQLQHLQLPLVELGIGIAYNPTPPRYLYDGDNRITISPAINRADRLSACAQGLRTWLADQKVPSYFHGSVYEPSDLVAQLGQKAQKDMVYNQNGIIMEPVAFDKLTKELKLSRIRNTIDTFSDSTFYISRYPDVNGNYHVLVVREAPVRIFDTANGYLESELIEGRKFYEVIYDRQVLKMLQKVQKSGTGPKTPINTRLVK